MKQIIALFAALITISFVYADGDKTLPENLARGKYLVEIGGCNDCHTPSYAETNGNTPEKEWLIGNPQGFSGPWGTTFASNLRIRVQQLTESDWIKLSRNGFRPPMPSPSLRAMTQDDLIAIYYYIKQLGPAGIPAPAYEPPTQVSAVLQSK